MLIGDILEITSGMYKVLVYVQVLQGMMTYSFGFKTYEDALNFENRTYGASVGAGYQYTEFADEGGHLRVPTNSIISVAVL